MVTVKVAIKGIALLGAALAIYVAAALQNGPEIADANFCKLVRRFSTAVPDQCLAPLDDYGTLVAIIVALAFVVLLLWDFKAPVRTKCTQAIQWGRPKIKKVSAKVEPHVVIIGLVIAVVGIAIAGYGAWKRPAAAAMPPAATTIPEGSMLSGRRVTGLEVVQRIERLEKQVASKDSELTFAKAQLETTRGELAKAKQPQANPQPTTAPFYTKVDVERLLEATFEITDMLQQKAIPARDAAELFLTQWNTLLLETGEPEFRAALKAVRLKVEAVNNDAWAISNKYQHYNSEIGPILSGVSFAEKFFQASNKFVEAGQNLPPTIDARTLTFMVPMQDNYQAGVETMKSWISQTYDRNRTATERFRLLSFRNESSEPAASTVTSHGQSGGVTAHSVK